jgi:hypothetical protein
MGVIQGVDVFPSGIALKFQQTVKVSTLTNTNITLYEGTATPVATPFETIDVSKHYNSISRTLVLYYKASIHQDTTYTVQVANLLNAAGQTIPTDTWCFQTDPNDDAIDDLDSIDPAPIEVIDHSIQSTAFIQSETIVVSNPDFYITATDPENYELYLEPDENNGRIIIKFSMAPDAIFLSKSYFRAQKKKVQRLPSRWADVDVRISLDSSRPWVYVDFPSLDATPVYATAGTSYFEAGFKYRIRIRKEVGY